MNTRIALSSLSIMAALALMGGAAFAFFSGTASSTNNIFAAGTLGLQLDDLNESTPSATVSASFGGSNLVPGATVSGFLSLHNSGSIDIAEIKLGANQTNNSNNGDGSNLADVLDLTVKVGDDNSCVTNATNLTTAINTALGGGGPLTLTKLNVTDYDSLPGLNVGPDRYLCMAFTMESTAGNPYQGDSITEDFILEAHQNVSQ